MAWGASCSIVLAVLNTHEPFIDALRDFSCPKFPWRFHLSLCNDAWNMRTSFSLVGRTSWCSNSKHLMIDIAYLRKLRDLDSPLHYKWCGELWSSIHLESPRVGLRNYRCQTWKVYSAKTFFLNIQEHFSGTFRNIFRNIFSEHFETFFQNISEQFFWNIFLEYFFWNIFQKKDVLFETWESINNTRPPLPLGWLLQYSISMKTEPLLNCIQQYTNTNSPSWAERTAITIKTWIRT